MSDVLTYYEKRFDYGNAGEGQPAGQMELIERQLYVIDHGVGSMLFPLGLKSRVSKALAAKGIPVTLVGGTLASELAVRRPDAVALDWDGLFADFTLYPGQDDCIAKITATDGGIIAANTGWGKSTLIKMICRLYHKATIHVVTKAMSVAKGVYDDLCTVIPDVGFVGNGKRRFGRVTVIMADSLHHGNGEADLVIADEGHELAAPSYAAKLGMYARARMFTMTATPIGRMDNRDVVVEAMFGPVIHTVTYQDAQAAGRVVPITVEWLRVNTGPNVSGLKIPAIREKVAVWTNRTRNQVIADRVKKCSDTDQILIMVKTIEHAVRLKMLLPEFTLAYASNGMDDTRLRDYINRGMLPPDEPLMTSARLDSMRRQFAKGDLKRVIANSVWSTGVDFPLLNVLIRADAAGSTIRDSQIPGRACRRVAGVKESALVIDCDDGWDGNLNRKAQGRRRNYQKRGWLQVWTDDAKGSNS